MTLELLANFNLNPIVKFKSAVTPNSSSVLFVIKWLPSSLFLLSINKDFVPL